MRRSKVEEIKSELQNCIETGAALSVENAQELLTLLDRIYSESETPKETTPMIGLNPFKGTGKTRDIDAASKDINTSLNYRVQRFNDMSDE